MEVCDDSHLLLCGSVPLRAGGLALAGKVKNDPTSQELKRSGQHKKWGILSVDQICQPNFLRPGKKVEAKARPCWTRLGVHTTRCTSTIAIAAAAESEENFTSIRLRGSPSSSFPLLSSPYFKAALQIF